METIADKQKAAFDALKKERGYKNPLEAPRIEKVVVSSGVGSITDPEKVEIIEDRLSKITGQKPMVVRGKKSIASFNVRAGDLAGYKVTLRGQRARSFMDKLIHIALPRTKDFRGLDPQGVDEMGNFTIGVPEHTVFPATSDEELKDVFGLAVTIVTSASTADEALAYLRHIGLPFQDQGEE